MSVIFDGVLKKMPTLHDEPIRYRLHTKEHSIELNGFIGQRLSFSFSGAMHCIQCERPIKKSFQQGHCYPCFKKIYACNNCMLHPERCLVETGACDPTDWAHAQCHQPHVVYLANASSVKVGITCATNQPHRWMDQGAIAALPIFKTGNRLQSGLIEVALKQFVADKTNWRVMLGNRAPVVDLVVEKQRILAQAKAALTPILKKYADQIVVIDDHAPLAFNYPVIAYPQKIKTQCFDKTPEIEGVLQGIKGQYLLLDSGVLNVRKYGGYRVCVALR